MFDIPAAITSATTLINGILDRLFPNPTVEQQAAADQLKSVMSATLSLFEMQAKVITAEAQSEGWLARSWRPITMLTFLALVVATFLGWRAPGVTDQMIDHMFSLIELGLTGYIIGRSAEKVIPSVADVWKRR